MTIIGNQDGILVTGAAGFLGPRVVRNLLDQGFRNVRCLARPSSNLTRLREAIESAGAARQPEVLVGDLLSTEDCLKATAGVAVIYHLAAGTGTKSFPEAFMNSVVTTRNLLEATLSHNCLKRFVSLSSFAVYTNRERRRIVDETSVTEQRPGERAEAYCFAKVRQDDLVIEYGEKHRLPYVILRPGVVFGPGKRAITGRIGLQLFGLFLHLGGANRIPFTYIDNCAEAIVLAGLRPGLDGEVINIVDDDLPTSRGFLRRYKSQVRPFRSIYVPHALSYLLSLTWEKYVGWSRGQLPALFSRAEWTAFWKKTGYSNDKAKRLLGWAPRVAMDDGLDRYFKFCRES